MLPAPDDDAKAVAGVSEKKEVVAPFMLPKEFDLEDLEELEFEFGVIVVANVADNAAVPVEFDAVVEAESNCDLRFVSEGGKVKHRSPLPRLFLLS